jgi:phosphoglucomutase
MNKEFTDLLEVSKKKANKWLDSDIDSKSKNEIIQLLHKKNQKLLLECFYKNLEFGTGGMRGIIGRGSNRVNKYTIGFATQGLSNYLNKVFQSNISIAIAYDSRKFSKKFAQWSAKVFSANKIKVYLFSELRPTPELSFAIRKLKCNCGIVITASHNPKEYNGYKVYWKDGGQITRPHDKLILNEINKLNDINDIIVSKNKKNISLLNEKIDKEYIKKIKSLSLYNNSNSNLKIIYTPIHGTGITQVPNALKAFGFSKIIITKSQEKPDPNFSTVNSPNPEEYETLKEGIKDLKKNKADILLATDPDGDRVGVAINDNNKIKLLNGNQLASLIVYYTLLKLKENKKLPVNGFIAKTIVTTNLIDKIATNFKVNCYSTLTGFKNIAELIKKKKNEKFIAGGEESYGYLVGDFIRDKDAIISSAVLCEIANWANSKNKNLNDILNDIYSEYGFYLEKLFTIKLEGIKGINSISNIMENYRNNPPKNIYNLKVIKIIDYMKNNNNPAINNKSNVIQLITKNNNSITIRPSGTEPKIKFYFSINSKDINNKKLLENLVNKEINLITKQYA